jgi:hypothetical protein
MSRFETKRARSTTKGASVTALGGVSSKDRARP